MSEIVLKYHRQFRLKWGWDHGLRDSSDRLGKPGIKLGIPGYNVSGLSTTPWRPQLIVIARCVCSYM